MVETTRGGPGIHLAPVEVGGSHGTGATKRAKAGKNPEKVPKKKSNSYVTNVNKTRKDMKCFLGSPGKGVKKEILHCVEDQCGGEEDDGSEE